MLERLRIWARSEADAIPLALLLLVSPLMPLTTLKRLREIGYYSYLPSPEDVLEGKRPEGLSEKAVEVLEATLQSQHSGSRAIFEEKIEELLSRTAVELELAEYNISQLFQLASLFTSVVPVTVASIQFLTNPEEAAPTLIACSVISIIVGGVIGLGLFPRELALVAPSLKTLFTFLISLAAYPLYSLLEVPHPLLCTFTTAAVPASVLCIQLRRRVLDSFREARKLVRRASMASYNIFSALEIDDPEYLLSPRWSGIARSATTALYMFCLYGGEKIREGLQRLELYIGRYLDYLFRIRERTRVMLIYAVVEAAVVAVMYSMLIGCLKLLGGEEATPIELITLPSYAALRSLEKMLDMVLSLNALGLSLATSSAREGQPLYFPMYLPLISGVMLAAYTAGGAVATSIIGGP